MQREYLRLKKKFKALKRSQADIARETLINYSRLTGFFNGYWDLNEAELMQVRKALTMWEDEKAALKAAA